MRVLFSIIIFSILFSYPAYAADTYGSAGTIQNVTTQVVDDTRIPIVVGGEAISASTRITDSNVTIVGIYWFSPTTVGHKCAIQDKDLNEIIEFYAVVAYQGIMVQNVRIPAKGIYMDDLDSGTVYFYLETH